MVLPVWMKRPFWVPPPKKSSPACFLSVWTVPDLSRSSGELSSITTLPPRLTVMRAESLANSMVVSPEVMTILPSASDTLAPGLLYLLEESGWAWIFALWASLLGLAYSLNSPLGSTL